MLIFTVGGVHKKRAVAARIFRISVFALPERKTEMAYVKMASRRTLPKLASKQ